MTQGYYFETATEMTEPELRLVLERAGVQAVDARLTTVNHNGVIITETLAKGIWNHETGYDQCNGGCNGQAKSHTGWDRLSPEQRGAFTRRLAEFMDHSRADQFSAAESIADDAGFESVALKPCDDA